MIRYNRKLNVFLFFVIFFQAISSWGQYKPEKIKGGLFVENKGQWEDNVLYRSEIPSGHLYIEKNRFLFNFYDSKAMAGFHAHNHSQGETDESIQRSSGSAPTKAKLIQAHSYEVAFLGCSPVSSSSGVNPQSYTYNYFKGDDPSKWASDAHAYSETILNDIYPNTSLVCFGQETGFKYEFHLKAGADASAIRMKYDGVDSVYLKNGELFVETSVTDFYEQKPFAYQEINGTRIAVPCQFKLVNNVLSFVFPKGYSKKFPLVIDPQLIFSTYSGSKADNWGNSATYDEDGNTYMVGIAFNQGYPTTVGAYQYSYAGYRDLIEIDGSYYYKFDPDVAIMKFNPTGGLLYATYLGGSGTETPSSCIVNSNKELVLFGMTSSDGRPSTIGRPGIVFPTTTGAYDRSFNGGVKVAPFGILENIYFDHGSDLFVSTLSTNGNQLVHSTFIGGSQNDGLTLEYEPLTRNYGDQLRGEIYCDDLNNIYIVSKTNSSNIINTSVPGFDKTLNGTNDAYLCKLSGDLSTMLWDTYVGGNDFDAGYSIRVASDYSVYITGGTTSTDLPGTSQGIKTSLSSGDTDGFISHISADGSTLLQSTYVGTESYDQCFFIQMDDVENIYVLGQTTGDYPMSPGVYGKASTGQFIQKLDPSLSTAIIATTIGNDANKVSLVPTAFLVNNCNNFLISGWGGSVNINYYPYAGSNPNPNQYLGGNTDNLPTTSNAFSKITDGSDFYLMVLEKEFKSLLYASYFGGYQERDHVDGGTSRFDKNGIVYQSVCGSCGGTSNFPVSSNAHSKTNKSSNCNNACFKFDLSDFNADFIVDKTSGCGETTFRFTNTSTGGVLFEWDLGDGTKITSFGPITHTYKEPKDYTVKLIVTDLTTCIGKDTAQKTISIFPLVSIGEDLSDTTICRGDTISLLKNCNPDYTYSWSPALRLPNDEILNPNTCDALFYPSVTRFYYLTVRDQNGCELKDTVKINVANLVAGIAWENLTPCNSNPKISSGVVVRLSNPSSGALRYYWTFGDGYTSTETSPVHEYAKGGTYPIAVDVYNDYCSLTATGTVKIDAVNIPNLFTPNGDTKNDCFEIVGLYPNWHVEIYNAWSKSIFKSNSYNNEFCGDNVSSGVYYYLVCAPYGDCCKSWVQIIKDK